MEDAKFGRDDLDTYDIDPFDISSNSSSVVVTKSPLSFATQERPTVVLNCSKRLSNAANKREVKKAASLSNFNTLLERGMTANSKKKEKKKKKKKKTSSNSKSEQVAIAWAQPTIDETFRRDEDEISPVFLARLQSACRSGNITAARQLLSIYKIPCDTALDSSGRTALHFACHYGHLRVVSLLIELGATVDTENFYGETPLHSACAKGHGQVAELLISNGADIYRKDEWGNNPVDLVSERLDKLGHANTAEELRSAASMQLRSAFVNGRLLATGSRSASGARKTIKPRHDDQAGKSAIPSSPDAAAALVPQTVSSQNKAPIQSSLSSSAAATLAPQTFPSHKEEHMQSSAGTVPEMVSSQNKVPIRSSLSSSAAATLVPHNGGDLGRIL